MKKTLLPIMLASSLTLSGCSTLSSLIEKPDDEKTVEEFYTDATEGFQEQQWDAAIQNYEKLKAYFPYGPHAEQTHLELAYAYYRYDEPESAILELEEFIRLYPKHPELAYAYYLKALAADSIIRSWLDNIITDPATRDVKSAKRAYNYYKELITLFPDSKYASAAGKRLVILRNQMARHELKVAQFYFNKEAYLASANRAKYIIENYAQSASTVRALEIMNQSYAKLGMKAVQQDVAKVYELNKNADDEAVDLAFGAQAQTGDNKPVKEEKSWWSKMTDAVGELLD